MLNRIYVSKEVDQRLRLLKSRTGLTPNLICRLGFCLSLAQSGVPDIQLYSDSQGKEFNRSTLTGQWDPLFFALLRERLDKDGLNQETDMESQFKAHISPRSRDPKKVQYSKPRVKLLIVILTICAELRNDDLF
jgi:DNA sulfur modification protein DndE